MWMTWDLTTLKLKGEAAQPDQIGHPGLAQPLKKKKHSFIQLLTSACVVSTLNTSSHR